MLSCLSRINPIPLRKTFCQEQVYIKNSQFKSTSLFDTRAEKKQHRKYDIEADYVIHQDSVILANYTYIQNKSN